MKKYEDLCNQILMFVGGKENIITVMHCETRLRLTLKDRGLVDQDAIKKIKEVLGCQFVGEQFQIIIGQYVHDVYEKFIFVTDISKGDVTIESNYSVNKRSIRYWFDKIVIDMISGSIMPILPIIVSAGIVKMIVTILGPNLLQVFPENSDVITLLTFVGDAGFYFLPIFIAWSAAKKMNTSIPIALFLGAILVHPTLIMLVNEQSSFHVFGIPMTLVSYSSQMLPSILMVWILSYVYKFLNQVCPNSVKMAVVPTCTVLIMLPIVLCVLGPIGTYCGLVISNAAVWLSSTVGPLAIGLIGGLWYFLVGLGMDKALVPVVANSFATYGYDSLFWLSAIMATYSLIGVSLAYIIRSSKEEKSASVSNAITLALGGISEPTIFGCVWKFKKAMIYLFTGGFVGGVIAGILQVKAYTIGTGNILFFTVCAGGDGSSLVPAIISGAVALLVSFILGIVFGFGNEVKKDS